MLQVFAYHFAIQPMVFRISLNNLWFGLKAIFKKIIILKMRTYEHFCSIPLNTSFSPLPTNDRREFVGADGSPLPVSDQGVVVVSPDGDLTAKTLPTDRTSKVIMPVLDENGNLRPTDYEGLYLDINGAPLGKS